MNAVTSTKRQRVVLVVTIATSLVALCPGPAAARDGSVAEEVQSAQASDTLALADSITFSDPMPFSPKGGSRGTGDFDGDGHLDLVSLSEDAITVLAGDGTGHLKPVLTIPPADRGIVRVGDVDGDGDPDLVVLNAVTRAEQLSVYLGDPGYGFSDPWVIDLPNRVPSGFQLADLDADGDLDAAIGVESSNPRLLLLDNPGDGRFDTRLQIAVKTQDVAVGDLDADGLADIVVQATSRRYLVLINEGDWAFEDPAELTMGERSFRFELGDLDGDGRMDLWADGLFTEDNLLLVRYGRGDGTFKPPRAYLTVGGSHRAIMLTDDRRPDLLSHGDDYLVVQRGRPGRTFGEAKILDLRPYDFATETPDFNDDGLADVVIVDDPPPPTGDPSAVEAAVLINTTGTSASRRGESNP